MRYVRRQVANYHLQGVRPRTWCPGQGVFLRALAISDTLVLITTCTEDNLDHANRLQNALASNVGLCKMWTGLSTTVSLLSPWLVVLLSVDRYVGVVFPLKRASFCTLKVAGISIAVLTAVAMVTRIPDVVFNTVLPEDGIPSCNFDIGSSSYIGYLQFSTIILASTIPCVLILGFNLRLLYTLKKDVRHLSHNRKNNNNNINKDMKIKSS
nr:hypothetical protein BaRGS_008036 [Batillaria attramentaria]